MKGNNLIYVGSLIPRKGILSLIGAIVIWNTFNLPKKKLIVCGTGILHPLVSFIGRCSRNISFKGYQSKRNVAQYLKQSDLLVLLSKREAFGLVYIEALMQGVPVAMLRDESFSKLVEQKKVGLVVRDRSYRSIKKLFLTDMPLIDQKKLIEISKVFSRGAILQTYKDLL